MNKTIRINLNFLKDEKIFHLERALSLTGYLRIGYIGLLTLADEQGCFSWEPNILKVDIMPFDDVDFELILSILLAFDIIEKYTFGDKEYGYFLNWKQNKNYQSAIPSKADNKKNLCTYKIAKKPVVKRPKPNQVIPIKKPINKQLPIGAVRTPIGALTFPFIPQKIVNKVKKFCPSCIDNNNQCDLRKRCNLMPVFNVFQCWQRQMNYPQAELHEKHIKTISQALNMDFTRAELCQAIYGYKCSPDHRGYSQQYQYKNGLAIIFQSREKINYFISHFRKTSNQQYNKKDSVHCTILKNWNNDGGNTNGNH